MSERKPPIWTKSFVSTALCNFFTFLTFYSLLTTLPIYVIDNLQRTKTEAGLIVTVFLLSAILVRPFSGKLLDDYGKKKMLFVSVVLFLLSTFMYVCVDQFYLLLALRFFHGIWFSIATTAAGAVAADVVPPTRRGEGLGYYAMSMNIAVVVGPFIALTLLQFISFKWLFLILGLLMIGGILCALSIRLPQDRRGIQNKRKLSFDDLFERKALPVSLVGSIVAFSYSSVISFISLYTKALDLMEAASFFFVVFAAAMLLSRPFVGRLFDTKGPGIVVYPAIILFGAGLITLSVTNSAFMLLLSGALVGLGYGSLVPCFQTLAVQSADNRRSGHATATFYTFFDTGIALGSYLLGMAASFFGYQRLYFYSALIVLLTLMLYRLVLHQTSRSRLLAKTVGK
jgi:predicted MFS family arabinose efflux permease